MFRPVWFSEPHHGAAKLIGNAAATPALTGVPTRSSLAQYPGALPVPGDKQGSCG